MFKKIEINLKLVFSSKNDLDTYLLHSKYDLEHYEFSIIFVKNDHCTDSKIYFLKIS